MSASFDIEFHGFHLQLSSTGNQRAAPQQWEQFVSRALKATSGRREDYDDGSSRSRDWKEITPKDCAYRDPCFSARVFDLFSDAKSSSVTVQYGSPSMDSETQRRRLREGRDAPDVLVGICLRID